MNELIEKTMRQRGGWTRPQPSWRLRAVAGLGLVCDAMIDVDRAMRARAAGRTFEEQQRIDLQIAGPYVWSPLGLIPNPYSSYCGPDCS